MSEAKDDPLEDLVEVVAKLMATLPGSPEDRLMRMYALVSVAAQDVAVAGKIQAYTRFIEALERERLGADVRCWVTVKHPTGPTCVYTRDELTELSPETDLPSSFN